MNMYIYINTDIHTHLDTYICVCVYMQCSHIYIVLTCIHINMYIHIYNIAEAISISSEN